MEDTGTSTRTTVDLAMGAAKAWLRPSFTGPDAGRRRLQASLATTWTAWCAGFLVAPAVNRALLDPPAPGVTGGVRALLGTAFVLFFVGWALALAGAAPVVVRSVLPAVRARAWTSRRPPVPAVLLGFAEAAGLLVIGITRIGSSTNPSWVARGGVALWLAGFALFVCALGVGPAASLLTLCPTTESLRFPSAITVPLALTLTAATGCSLAAAAAARDATLVSSPLRGVRALAG